MSTPQENPDVLETLKNNVPPTALNLFLVEPKAGHSQLDLNDDDLFNPNTVVDHDDEDEDLDEEDDEDEEEEIEEAEIAQGMPELPAILFYDSESHGKRRYYLNSLKGKPAWVYEKDSAYVFANLDHLKLAGSNCKHYGYHGLDFESVK